MRKIYSFFKVEVVNIDRKWKRLKKKRGIVDIIIYFLFLYGMEIILYCLDFVLYEILFILSCC